MHTALLGRIQPQPDKLKQNGETTPQNVNERAPRQNYIDKDQNQGNSDKAKRDCKI